MVFEATELYDIIQGQRLDSKTEKDLWASSGDTLKLGRRGLRPKQRNGYATEVKRRKCFQKKVTWLTISVAAKNKKETAFHMLNGRYGGHWK
jgi:hypothetical protein